MYQNEDKYIFIHRDEHRTIEIKGTIKEIAFAIYKDWIGLSNHNYGVIGYGPFFLEENKDTGVWEVIVLIDTIDPEPSKEFWDEMNHHINRFFETLTAFS